MADTATKAPAKTRRTPTFTGEHEGPAPKRERDGFWKNEMEKRFRPNPRKIFTYGDVSASTATNLRRDYGLDAFTNNRGDVTTLYVQYDPERVETIKAQVHDRGAKRKATIEANRAKNGGKSQSK
jgi:hypothetical protein